MKKRYQIEQRRAVQQFRRLATEQNPNIQMILLEIDVRTGIRRVRILDGCFDAPLTFVAL